jgi:hypothetical protein
LWTIEAINPELAAHLAAGDAERTERTWGEKKTERLSKTKEETEILMHTPWGHTPKISVPIVDQRPSTHGDFERNTVFMQRAKELMRLQPNWHKMEPYQREALEQIIHKLGRILHGDHEHVDHWDDVGGYAACVTRVLRSRN